LFKINRPLACRGIGYKLRDKCIKRKGGRSGNQEDLTNGIEIIGHGRSGHTDRKEKQWRQ